MERDAALTPIMERAIAKLAVKAPIGQINTVLEDLADELRGSPPRPKTP